MLTCRTLPSLAWTAEDLIQRKLNNVEAPLRRRIQQISQLLASSAAPSVEGEGSDVTMQSTEGDDDQLKAEQVWTLFNAQLREVELGVKKVGIVERMEERMRAKYEAKGKQIGPSPLPFPSSSQLVR